MPASLALRRWVTIRYWHPFSLFIGFGLLLGLVGYRVQQTWASVGLDIGGWKRALETWFTAGELLLLVVSLFILAVYDRLCLLNGQMNELVALKSIICEDDEGSVTPGFMRLLSAHGLGRSANRQGHD